MKTVIWISENNDSIPNVGVPEKDKQIAMPIELADYFIGKGMAKELSTKNVTRELTETLPIKE